MEFNECYKPEREDTVSSDTFGSNTQFRKKT